MLKIFTSENQIIIMNAVLTKYHINLWVRTNIENPLRKIAPRKAILKEFTIKRAANEKDIIAILFFNFIFGRDIFKTNKR